MEYIKVKLRGNFDYEKEVLMGPRQLFNYADSGGGGGGSFMGPSSTPTGYHVITPFHLEGHK
jgi:cytochrome oxidase assembly protein ShyY1